MKIEPKTITLKNKQTAILRSPEVQEAQIFLDHLFITHTESYKFLESTAELWKNFSVKKEEGIIEHFITTSNKFLVTAFIDDVIVGGLGVMDDARPFRTHSVSLGMSIQKAYHNQGLGTQAMAYALENATKAELTRIELKVRDYNPSAIKLYENFNFKRVGTLNNAAIIDGKFVNEYLYEKLLT